MPEFVVNGIDLAFPASVTSPKVVERLKSGRYEHVEASAARKRVRAGDRVLELGAGLGYVSCICAEKAGAANLLSIEANPEMLPIIRGNLDRNGHTVAQLRHGAVVGDTNGQKTIPFHVGPAFWGSSLVETEYNSRKEIDVPLLSVFDLIDAHDATVVMMDIEGAEAEMFDRAWPQSVRLVMMELHPKMYDLDTIRMIFDRLSETGLAYDPGISHGDVVGLRRPDSA